MILQKLTQAILRQDWFQVLIEVLIVIVGIFLGLQANSWNEERLDRIEERIYLGRLLEDADNSIENQLELISDIELRNVDRQALIQMLYDKNITIDKIPTFSRLFVSITNYYNLIYFEDTLDELISSGNISIISSLDFRNKISRFRARIEQNERILSNIEGRLALSEHDINLEMKWSPNYNNLISTPAELNNNEELYILVNRTIALLDIINNDDLQFHEETKVFREEIAAELARLQ